MKVVKSKIPLDYCKVSPQRRKNKKISMTLLICSLVCVVIPVAGWVTSNGLLFIVGSLIAPLAGIVMGIVGMISTRRMQIAYSISIGLNCVQVMLFAYLFFL